MDKFQEATVKLFRAIQVEDKTKKQVPSPRLLQKMLKSGFMFQPEIRVTDRLLDLVDDILGLSGTQANAAFHKSWAVIRDTDQETLWLQASIHYLTTYGWEALGIYSEDTVFIPQENLRVPKKKDDLPLIVIKALTKQEILEKVITLGGGIALSKESLDAIMVIVEENEYSSSMIKSIGNRELRARLNRHFGILPTDPVEFLRQVIVELTGESLVIKNKALIDKIKQADGGKLDHLMTKAPKELGSIFLRYKPLFLAMKAISHKPIVFNQLRRAAKIQHKPLPEDVLNNVTARIKHGSFDAAKLFNKLETASVFRKIRLAQALKIRENPPTSIVYKVRNGRGWATDFAWQGDTKPALELVQKSLACDLANKVCGKTVYIPPGISYALPATEKQFFGMFPAGTSVEVSDDMVIGIHWKNTHKRVDLDFSALSITGKVGWDSSYRSNMADVLFSGDMTDARKPKGASELFYIKAGMGIPQLFMVNYFNQDGYGRENDTVDMQVFVAQEKIKKLERNYLVDPNNILASTTIKIGEKQTVVGALMNVDGKLRFYFSPVGVGKSITSSSMSKTSVHTREYFTHSLWKTLDIRDVLVTAGAMVVSVKPKKAHIDLSPTAVTKTSFLELLTDSPV